MESAVFNHSTLEVEVKIPALDRKRNSSQNPTPVEQIGLVFTHQIGRRRFNVAEDGATTLVWEAKGLRVPLSDHQLSVDIFNHGEDSLRRYLSWSFMSFEEDIDAETVADEIINRWVRIREEVNARSSDKVFPMTVNLISWDIEMRHERGVGGGDYGMIPASDGAIREMLKRVRIEEEESGSCVICMEELSEEDGYGRYALEMPCLHVFHGVCIEKWLRKSHCCPVCRFQMPTDSNS